VMLAMALVPGAAGRRTVAAAPGLPYGGARYRDLPDAMDRS